MNLKMAAPMWKDEIEVLLADQTNVSGVSIISKEVERKSLTLLTLVEHLGQYMTSTDTNTRKKAILLLANILESLPSDAVCKDEIEVLTIYFCERLKDHHSVQPPTLKALLALCKNKAFGKGCAEKISRSIFAEIQNQTLAQGDRYNVYSIIFLLLERFKEDLKSMGSDFVYGFVQLLDMEKDPRNLLLAFSVARTVIQSFPLGVFVEEMFEVISCYFPIDFTPPPNDTNKISREDLILALRKCLAASSQFGPFCYPLLLEKLTSDVKSAQIDALDTLTACAEVYGPKPLIEFQSSFFNCIKREVFGAGDETLESSALSALRSITSALSQEISDAEMVKDSCLAPFLDEIKQELNRYLLEEDLRLLVPSCGLLINVCAGSPWACCYVLDFLLPTLVQIHHTHNDVKDKKKVTDILSRLLGAVRQQLNDQVKIVLTQSKKSLLQICKTGFSSRETSLCSPAALVLCELLQIPGLLTIEEKHSVAAEIFELFKNSSEIRDEMSRLLHVFAQTDGKLIISELLPKFFKEINSSIMESQMSVAMEKMLTAMSVLTVSLDTLTVVMEFLVLCMETLLQNCKKNACCKEQLIYVLQCMQTIANNSFQQEDMMTYLYNHLLYSLYDLMICSPSWEVMTLSHCICQEDVIQTVADIIQQILSTQSEMKQLETYEKVSKLYISNPATSNFCPLEGKSFIQCQSTGLLLPVLCFCPMQTLQEDLSVFVKKFEQSSDNENCYCLFSIKCVACLVNKWKSGKDLDDYLDKKYTHLQNAIQQWKSSDMPGILKIQELIWITKALAVRGHSRYQIYMKLLIDQLESPFASLIAEGFATIVSDCDKILTRDSNANYRIMYKQRLYVENADYFLQRLKVAEEDKKAFYLMSLFFVMNQLPKSFLLSELPDKFHMLVLALQCENLDLKMKTIAMVTDLIQSAHDVVCKYLDSLIAQLLKLIKVQACMKVRIAALKCLGALTDLPERFLLPHQRTVTQSLESSLDDKKRLVRKEAVIARGLWFSVGDQS